MARTSFTLPDEVDEFVEERLVYGQSKSEWYRYASSLTADIEEELDELYDPFQFPERREFVRAAVKQAIRQEKDQPTPRGHTERIEDMNPDE